MNFGYADEAVLLVTMTPPPSLDPAEPARLAGQLIYLVCAQECVPGSAELRLTLPVAGAAAAADPANAALFARARAALPEPAPGPVRLASAGDRLVLSLDAPISGGPRGLLLPLLGDGPRQRRAPGPRGRREGPAPDPDPRHPGRSAPERPAGRPRDRAGDCGGPGAAGLRPRAGARGRRDRRHPGLRGAGAGRRGARSRREPDPVGRGRARVPRRPHPQPDALRLPGAVDQGAGPRRQSGESPARRAPARPRLHGRRARGLRGARRRCCSACAPAAPRSAGASSCSRPIVVALLAYLLFAMGLSLSGVVHLGSSLQGSASGLAGGRGLAGSFLTGVLAAVVATPCTAPFMGDGGRLRADPAGGRRARRDPRRSGSAWRCRSCC